MKQSASISSFLFGVIQGSENSSQKTRSEELKNIRRRKDGRWELRVSTPSGRQSVYAKTLKQLLEIRKKQLLEHKRDVILLECQKFKVKTKLPNIIEYAKKWLAEFKGPFISKSSADMYRLAISYLKDSGLDKSFDEVKTEDLQKAINKITKPRIKDYAVMVVKQTFKRAYQDDIISKDISQFIEKGKVERKSGRNLTLVEQKLLLDNLHKTKIGKVILAYLLTGCRKSELLAIKREDVNFEKNVIYVKGTKTKNARRYVQISEEFKNMLEADFESFIGYSKDIVSKQFKKFVDELGIKDVSIHSLRHTYSTNLHYLGVTDKQRQGQLGHASIVITNDIYTHLDPTITKQDIIKLYGNLYPNYIL